MSRIDKIGAATLYLGDVRERLSDIETASVKSIITSPPFWRQRDYECAGQIGIERTPSEFADELVAILRDARRLLTRDGSLWIEIGDTYAAGGNGGGGSRATKRRKLVSLQQRTGWRKPPPGYKEKDLSLTPFVLADRLRQDGWYLRKTIIWNKGTATEPPRIDRPSVSHSYIFLLTKARHSQVRNPGEAWFASSVWSVAPAVGKASGDHPAAMTPEIARRCIVSGTREGDTVLDPFLGSGTTAAVALIERRRAIGIELNRAYFDTAHKRIAEAQRQASLFDGEAA